MNKILIAIAILLVSVLLIWRTTKRKPALANSITHLIVGTNAEYPPFTFVQDDAITGFDIDIVQEVAKRIGATIEFKDLPFDALLPEAQIGTIHLIAAGITATPERAQNLLFTQPYVSGDPLVILSKKDQPITHVNDLSGKRVVVNEGFVADFYMSGIKGPEIIRLGTLAEGFLALKSGRADAFVTARTSAQSFLEQNNRDRFISTPIPGTSDNYSLGISKQYAQLLDPIQKALDTMQADGIIDTLKIKWKVQ